MNSFLAEWGDFDGHNDPDMLEVGNGYLTIQERRSHFALWAIMKSPLLIGTNMVNITQENIDILQNEHLLAFNQDDLYGKAGQPYKWYDIVSFCCFNLGLLLTGSKGHQPRLDV